MVMAQEGIKMARGRRPRRQGRNSESLHETGFRLALLGLAFLIAPKLFDASPMMKVVSAGLSLPGWLLLAAGVLILGIVFVKKKSMQAILVFRQSTEPLKPAPRTAQEKRELGENIFHNAHAKGRTATKTATPPDSRFRREPVMSPDINFGRKADDSSVTSLSKSTEWSPAVFSAIEWRRFEAVCETLFGQAGFETRSQTHGADGGVDIWLYSRHAEGAAAIVQCKHWQGTPVGVKEMREFYGVMASHQLKRGTYATTSTYTADAQKFAKDNGINAMDGAGLLRLIATRTPEQQQALLTVAFEGDYWRPTCASCGIKLVDRKPSKGGAAFWGCSNYPRCKSRLPMAMHSP